VRGATLGGMAEQFTIEGHGPQAYERFLVPALFAECASRLLDAASPRPGDRVLDVACGTGIVARRAAARAPLDHLVGVDVNEAMLDVARSVPLPGPVRWHQADAAALPFAEGSFDVAYCQQGLQYFGDPSVGLGEMARVLVPGGCVALGLWRPIEHNAGFALLVDALDRHVGHEAADVMRSPFVGPGPEALRRLLASAGFHRPRIRLAVIMARFPSVREFLQAQILASPRDGLAQLTGRAQPGAQPRWDLVAKELAASLSAYVDDEGVVLPSQTWLVTARRTGGDSPVEAA
jgi:SAM-dependent methyltransferase